MANEREKLRQTLAELHAELAGLDASDEGVQEMLRGALAEIHAALEKRGAAARGAEEESEEEPASISERLSEAAQHFEGRHPTLSGTLGSVIDALGRMGI